MANNMSHLKPLPWYRYFWTWFILGLLSAAIMASLLTLYIAINNPDQEVSKIKDIHQPVNTLAKNTNDS